MARKEKDFLTELKRSTHQIQPCLWWKIPDAGFRNYFDVVCCFKGDFIAVEAKFSKLKTKINFKQLFSNREHELQAMKKVEDAGGKAFIMVNVFQGHYKNFAYSIPFKAYEFIKFNESIHLATLDEFMKRFYKKDGVWPIEEMLSQVHESI